MIDLNSDDVRIKDECSYGDFTITMGREIDEPFVNVQNESAGLNNTYYFRLVDDMESAFDLVERVLYEIYEQD